MSDYKGGSRRVEAFGSSSTECNPIYQDAMFGTVKALQMAGDGGQCQGGSGGIVAVVGKKLFIKWDLGYDLKTKQIYRMPVIDTIISTLRPQ